MKSIKITIRGKVQGVWFRKFTKEQADKLSVVGFVENIPDGAVLVHAQGNENDLNIFVEWCKKGPLLAKVTSIEVVEIEEVSTTEFVVK